MDAQMSNLLIAAHDLGVLSQLELYSPRSARNRYSSCALVSA